MTNEIPIFKDIIQGKIKSKFYDLYTLKYWPVKESSTWFNISIIKQWYQSSSKKRDRVNRIDLVHQTTIPSDNDNNSQ